MFEKRLDEMLSDLKEFIYDTYEKYEDKRPKGLVHYNIDNDNYIRIEFEIKKNKA